MPRHASSFLARALIGAVLLLWLAAQAVTLAHQLDVDDHPATCDWCLTHASVGHALGTPPLALPPAGAPLLVLGLAFVTIPLRFVHAYRGRAPPR